MSPLIFTTFQGQFGDILPLNGSPRVPGVEFGAPQVGAVGRVVPQAGRPCEVQIEANEWGGRNPPGRPEGAGIRVFDGPTVSLFPSFSMNVEHLLCTITHHK